MQPRLTIGILLYQSSQYRLEQYLKTLFDSIFAQTWRDFVVLVLDNGSENTDYIDRLKEQFPRIQFFRSETNLGFAKGHNLLINASHSPLYLVLNPDMFLEPDCIEKLVSCYEASQDRQAGLITPLVYRWNFDTYQKTQGNDLGKTGMIDTTGLGLNKRHAFFERGQGEQDTGQYEEGEIFGASGSCMLLAREALESIRFEDEYFDSLMFMYKEDIDLSYRLRWAGFRAFFCPKAIVYHDRSVAHTKPFFIIQHKSRWVQENSYLNEKILLFKNLDSRFPFGVRWGTMLRQWAKRIYALLFAPYLLKQEKIFREYLPLLKTKRQAMARMADPREIVRFMV